MKEVRTKRPPADQKIGDAGKVYKIYDIDEGQYIKVFTQSRYKAQWRTKKAAKMAIRYRGWDEDRYAVHEFQLKDPKVVF